VDSTVTCVCKAGPAGPQIRVPLPFRCGWSRPRLSGSGRNRHGSRPAPPLAGSPARIGCVVCSSARPSQTALYPLWEKCWQNHLDTPKGPHIGAINRTTTGNIPKPLPRARGPVWRRRLHRRSDFETSTASASADSARLTVPARGHWGPIGLPGEKSREPDSTHPRRPPRNRDWLLRCLSSGFGCMLS
jgi:hypothetical protein